MESQELIPEQNSSDRFTLWKDLDFLKLWSGQTFSIFGSLVGRIALPLLVIYTLNATPQEVSWIRAAEIAPGMFAGLVLGVWIDRLKRRPILIGTDICRALLVGSIPFMAWMGQLTWIQVGIVAAIVSVLTVCFDVSYEAYLPSLVGTPHLLDANSKLAASASVAEVSGFGISGALFEWIGGAFTLVLDAFTFFISAFSLVWIRKPEPHPVEVEHEPSILLEAKEGIKVLLKNRMLLTLAGIDSLGSICGGILGTVYMLYISRDLQISPGSQGVVYAFGGISSFIGASLAEPFLNRFGLGKTLVGSSLIGLIGVTLVPSAFGAQSWILVFLFAQQLLGDGPDTIYQIQVTSLRQTVTPNHLLGRVNAAWRVSSWLFLLAGTLAGGLLGEWIGLRAAFFVAIIFRAIGLLWLFTSPIRSLREMPAPYSPK